MANFNVPPYFDDYNESKGYYKVLFRPSVAIQARELNQMQTMLQKQIERFGSHIFREGSIVIGGAFDLELDMAYIKASAVAPAASRLQEFVGKNIIGATSGITAVVRAAVYDEINNVYVFLIRYLSASTTSNVFLDSENVRTYTLNNDGTINVDTTFNFDVTPSNSTGFGSVFSISQGVVFSKGYFLAFPSQTVIVDKYSQTPSATIGLQVAENFVTDLTDDSLLDNALGTSNENAPGAHRYQLEATLVSLEYKAGYDDENFIPFLDVKAGVIETNEERSQYARIYDELAKRTFDESGDYYVRGFNVRTREHLDTGVNEGLLFANAGGNSSLLSIDVEPGIAYVKGYEVNKLVTEHVVTDKAVTYNYVNNQLVNARTGGYFLIKEVVGSVDHDKAVQIDLFANTESRITTNKKANANPSATNLKIGTAYVKALVYESGQLGTNTAQMRAYLYDFNLSNGYIISDVQALRANTSGNFFFADVANTSLNDENNNVLLFPLGAPHIRTIRSNTGTNDTKYQFNRSINGTIDFDSGNGTFTVAPITTTGESLAYTEGLLSSAEKRELLLTVSGDKDITLTGTINASSTSSNVITGNSTDFTKLNIGDRIKVDTGSEEYIIQNIVNATSLTVSKNVVSTFTSNVFYRALRNGDVIDLTTTGTSGIIRTANVSSGSLIVDIQEVTSATGSVDAKLTFRVDRDAATAGGEIRKFLRPSRFVQIQTNTNIGGTSGPYNLGIPDVYKIRSVRMHTTSFTTGTEGSNVTSSFTLDNGQRDNYYDHGKLNVTGAIDLTNKNLLVELDHFEADYSTGLGYFSIDSYPIDDNAASNTTIFTYQVPKYTSSVGIKYDLRNVLDFRAYKTSTASSSTTASGATVNPTTTTTFSVDTNGLRMVAPDSDITTDYSFYLARRDVITLDKQGIFNVIKGEPSNSPISPNVPDNVMGIANIYIPPYPSVSETLARIINDPSIGCITRKIAQIRYTMREIGVLKSRIENLEYYNALTLLEKSAVDLKITDSSGLDRFKNGFFVDGFLDHSLGDSGNPDYKVAIDKLEQIIRPFFEVESFQYRLETSGSSNYKQTGSLITLPYSNTILLENRNVTTIRNIEQGVFRFIGTVELTPDGDTWCDVTTVDKVIPFGDDIPIEETITTEWGSWETYQVGYNVYDRNVGDRSGTIDPNKFLGSYNSYAAALAATKVSPVYRNNKAQGRGTDSRALIETVTSEQRTGIVTTVTSETQLEEFGNFVTDVSVKPYIRPQTITVTVKGLKANTRFYLYFDGENMSDYTTPIRFVDNPGGGITVVAGEEGDPWRSDEYGEAFAYLRLPDTGKKFRTGTKEVIVTDSPTNAIDATSYGKTHWTATGIAAQKQNTILSTKVPVIQQEEIVETRQKQKVEVMGPSCMAYSFKVDVPRGEDGIFLTSVDVWVEAKHPTLGTWFEIREMNSAGGITRTQVPYSEVWLRSSDFNLWDGTASEEEAKKTTISFPVPIFLLNNTQYAFVIHTEGLNPDYYFWVSRLGETDILTGKQVTSRQITGTLYTTNNNLNYDMVPDVDLKVRFNRANFTAGSGTVILGNRPTEFLKLSSITGAFNKSGETVVSSNILNLSNTVFGANTIEVGDQIHSTNSHPTTNAISGNVIAIVGSNYYTDKVGFSNAKSYSVKTSGSVDKFVNGTILSVTGGSGTLRSYNSTNNFMIIDDSNGLFFANAVVQGVLSNNSARVSGFDQYKYSTTTLKPYYLTFNKTALSFEKAGWRSNTSANSFDLYTGSSEWFPGTSDSYSSFNNEVTVLSRVNELAKFGNTSPNSSAKVKAVLTSTSSFVSPVIDISRAQSIYVHNIINNDDPDVVTITNTTNGSNSVIIGDRVIGSTSSVNAAVVSVSGNVVTTDKNGFILGEVYSVANSSGGSKSITGNINRVVTTEGQSSGGNLLNRYISKPVTLADGQDAEDLIVKLTAYRPPQSDVKVWMKIRNGDDNVLFSQNEWIELSYQNNFFSSEANKNDFVELDYTVPTKYKHSNNTVTDVIQYIKGATNITANTIGINAAANSILITAANTIFTANDEVFYSVPPEGTPITPLTANTYYFIDTANSTAITLKSTKAGAQIDITDFRTDVSAEIHTIGGDVYNRFKQYSIKIGLQGTNSAKPPRVGDLRVIALQT